MKKIIELNKNLYDCFFELAKHSGKSEEEIKSAFLSSKQRMEVLKTFFDNYWSFSEASKARLYDQFVKYFSVEEQLQSEVNLRKEMVSRYEDSILAFNVGNVSDEDLDNLFNCLRDAYSNYSQGKFENAFTFFSEEMNDTFYHGKEFELQVPKEKLPHLLGLPNATNDKKLLPLLYSEYLKSFPNADYFEFLLNDEGAKKYIKIVLSSKDEINDNTKKKLCLELGKIFSKCINFRKIYEFKFIPEIVLDYSVPESKEIINEMKLQGNKYNYKFGSGAFRKIYASECWTLKELVDSFDELTEDGQLIVRRIEEFMNFKDNENADDLRSKIIITKPNKDSSIKELGNCRDFKFRHISEEHQYSYYVSDGNISTDMQPNLWLLSYDEATTQAELLHSKAMLLKAITIYILMALDKMGVDFFSLKADRKIDLFSILSKADYNLDLFYIYETNKTDLEEFDKDLEVYFGERDRNVELDENYSFNIADIKRSHLLNPNFVLQLIDSLSIIDIYTVLDLDEFISVDELAFVQNNDSLKRQMNEAIKKRLSDYYSLLTSTSDGKEAYNNFFINISSLCKYNGNNSVFDQFHLYVVESERGLKSDDDNAYDSTLPISTFLPLAQHLKMNFFTQRNLKADRYDMSVGTIGYCFNEEIEENVSNLGNVCYPKTFMGKNMLQVLADFRINGRAFMIDTVYSREGKDLTIFHTPLMKDYSPFLELAQSLYNEGKIDDNLFSIISKNGNQKNPNDNFVR